MCTSANWKKENFIIKNEHILLVEPVDKIAKITLPKPKIMSWYDALLYSYLHPGYWKIPTIEELQGVLNIYGFLGINTNFGNPVWASTTQSIHDPQAKALDFSNGQVLDKDKNEPLEVVCIHY